MLALTTSLRGVSVNLWLTTSLRVWEQVGWGFCEFVAHPVLRVWEQELLVECGSLRGGASNSFP